MYMETQVKTLCRSLIFHIRNISAIRHLLPESAAAQLMHSLVTSRLDYCNSLLHGIPQYRIKQLQRKQNIAARVVSRDNSRQITPVLKKLHWLPVKQRILFKLLLLVYKSVNNLAPEYLCNLFVRVQHERSMRSNSLNRLKPPTIKLKSYGKRSFMYAGAVEWNELPLDIKNCESVSAFKTKLKTYLFQQHFK